MHGLFTFDLTGCFSLGTRLYCVFFKFIIYKYISAPILHRDLWPTVGHLVHTIPTQWSCHGSKFPTTLLLYRSAVYPQGMAFN